MSMKCNWCSERSEQSGVTIFDLNEDGSFPICRECVKACVAEHQYRRLKKKLNRRREKNGEVEEATR